ncbi:unnamed protein product [Caenorhabditis nigoni]
MMRVARMTKIDEFVSQMAGGYDTICGERGDYRQEARETRIGDNEFRQSMPQNGTTSNLVQRACAKC